MVRFYRHRLDLFTLCETRWNSMQGSFASLLRVRSALQMLARKYKEQRDFLAVLGVLDDRYFWDELDQAEQVIAPLSEASYRLQRDENTMADVVTSYRDISRGFKQNAQYGSVLVDCIEKRWAQCEQPLFMLAYVLHPKFVNEARKMASLGTRVSDSVQVCKFAVYYFRRFIGSEFGLLRRDMRRWIIGELTTAGADEFPDSVAEFWQYVAEERRESKLLELAIKVLLIAVNTATCERLFSELGMIHTAKRNSMTSTMAKNTHIVCKPVLNSDRKAASEDQITNCIILSGEREIIGAGLSLQRRHMRDETAERTAETRQQPGFTSPTLRTPCSPRTPRTPRSRTPLTNDDDDVGDGVDGAETFSLWEEYLGEVFEDTEFDSGFAAREHFTEGESLSGEEHASADSVDETDLAPIPQPDTTPFPSFNDPHFSQKRTLSGIHACKATLTALFSDT
ncbi:hypothetical protein BBJ28_00004771 [Nothophytophthora sp. Chile5]|nr:hypothetical protein BBJ28_00004771 [Nothophytophthora sp. Chile5]